MTSGTNGLANDVILSVTVGSITDRLTGNYSVYDTQSSAGDPNLFGFLDPSSSPIVNVYSTSFASYDLASPINATLPVNFYNSFGTKFATASGGTFSFNNVSGNVTVSASPATAVPEPSSMVLAAIAAAVGGGLFMVRRRRRGAV